MPEGREELLRHYRESRESLLAAIEGLTDHAMSEASIDGWSVKDHLAHMALWDDIRAAEVDRISSDFESAWKMTEDDDEALNEKSTLSGLLLRVGGSMKLPVLSGSYTLRRNWLQLCHSLARTANRRTR